MPLALSGGPYAETTVTGTTEADFITGIAQALVAGGWVIDEAVPAFVLGAGNALPAVNSGLHIFDQWYYFRSNPTAPNDVQWTPSIDDCLYNLQDVINSHNTKVGMEVGDFEGGYRIKLHSRIPGPTGNSGGRTVEGCWDWWYPETDSHWGVMYGGGYRLKTKSPQNKWMKLYIAHVLDTQFHPTLSLRAEGYKYATKSGWCRLNWGADHVYKVVASPCHFAIWQPGVQTQCMEGSSCFGGILYLDPVSQKDVRERWWAVQTDYGPWFSTSVSPRLNLLDGVCSNAGSIGNPYNIWVSTDNQVQSGAWDGAPRIQTYTGTEAMDYVDFLHQPRNRPMFPDGTPLIIEPWISKSQPGGSARLFAAGQLYDACVLTRNFDPDITEEGISEAIRNKIGMGFKNYKWINVTWDYPFGSLFYIRGKKVELPTLPVNYVY